MNIKSENVDSTANSGAPEIVTWSDKFATGIEMIDEQHRQLVILTNQLYQACLAGHSTAGPVFLQAMTRMVEYVRFHFSAEQKLLERIGFPDYKDHKMQHDTMVRNILDAAKDYNEGKQFVPNAFVRTLKDWVFGHIAVYDKTYAAYVANLKSKGLISDQQINGQ